LEAQRHRGGLGLPGLEWPAASWSLRWMKVVGLGYSRLSSHQRHRHRWRGGRQTPRQPRQLGFRHLSTTPPTMVSKVGLQQLSHRWHQLLQGSQAYLAPAQYLVHPRRRRQLKVFLRCWQPLEVSTRSFFRAQSAQYQIRSSSTTGRQRLICRMNSRQSAGKPKSTHRHPCIGRRDCLLQQQLQGLCQCTMS